MKTLILKARRRLPACVRPFHILKGICVGRCIDPNNTIDTSAHAHVSGDCHGWICLKHKFQLKERLVLLHEVAHLLVGPNHDHDRWWRDMVVAIGGTVKPYLSIASNKKKKWLYPGYNDRGKRYYGTDYIPRVRHSRKTSTGK